LTPRADRVLGALRRAERDHEARFPDAPPPILAFDPDPADARVLVRAIHQAIRDGRPLPYEVAWSCTSADRFDRALDAYGRRFRRQGLPFLRCCDNAASRDIGARLMRRAVMEGKPLGWWSIARALGLQQPPDGVPI
jgi:hypothetical protein